MVSHFREAKNFASSDPHTADTSVLFFSEERLIVSVEQMFATHPKVTDPS